jgi:hypothetical protein
MPNYAPNSAITCFGHAGADARVCFVNSENHIIELAWEGGWKSTDLTQLISAPAPRPGTALACFGVKTTNTRLYYFNSENHVIELAWLPDWLVPPTDLTAATGAPAARPGSGLACFGVNGSDSRVYFIDTGSEVHELAWANSWSHNPIGSSTHAPKAGGSGLACFGVNGSDSRVYYTDTKNNVNELAWANNWSHNPIGAQNGAPQAAPWSALTCFGVNNADSRVYYVAEANNDIIELAWANTWKVTDVREKASTPYALTGMPIACFGHGNDSRVYYFADGGQGTGLIWELGWVNGNWQPRDVSALAVPFGNTNVPSGLACYGVNGADSRVYCIDTNKELNELAWVDNSKWVRNLL